MPTNRAFGVSGSAAIGRETSVSHREALRWFKPFVALGTRY
jgi:hypothetical protein